ncbi:ABC transporter permease subunit [Nonomuraea dietziae]|uniref:ABC transporter permease subunit n=1 Tax=Nonomuraea dietziae TaxID=65515 RepID=UPI003401DD41
MIRSLLGRSSVVAGAIALTGALPWLSGKDPALSLLRARSAEQEPTAEALAAIRADLGLDAGPVALTGRWLAGLLRGDAGTSWVSGRPVLPGVVSALGVSLTLMAAAMVVALAVALGVCVLRGRGAGAALLASVPEFLLATGLLIVVAVWLGWLPPYGWHEPRHLILPAIALGVPTGGLLGRLADDALRATLREPWVTTWRAAGFPPTTIAKAAVRRALPALLPQVGLVVVGLTGGAVAVETIFAIPGIGRTALGAAESQDLPVLQASVLIPALMGVIVGVLADLARRGMLGTALTGAALMPPPPGNPGRSRVLSALLAMLLLGVIGWGLLRDPTTLEITSRLAAPSPSAPLGADAVGRDVLARIGHGALATAGVAALVCLAAYVVGMVVALLPALATSAAEAVNALPPVLTGLVVAALYGPGVPGASLAVGLVAWAPLAVHAAALFEEARAAQYLTAERALGASERWIFWRHVLPAVAGPVARHAVLRLPANALAIASLGFLGLGAQPPSSEWGLMLAESLPYVERAPWAALSPAAALAVLAALAVRLSTGDPRRRTRTPLRPSRPAFRTASPTRPPSSRSGTWPSSAPLPAAPSESPYWKSSPPPP